MARVDWEGYYENFMGVGKKQGNFGSKRAKPRLDGDAGNLVPVGVALFKNALQSDRATLRRSLLDLCGATVTAQRESSARRRPTVSVTLVSRCKSCTICCDGPA